ncbi:serine threonine- kinase mos-like, partial [Paramuricea clavata]
NVCKVGDFGCSEIVEDTPVSPTRSYLTGTFAYRAPELLRGQSASCKADIYSMGICLWQFWTRDTPLLECQNVNYQVITEKADYRQTEEAQPYAQLSVRSQEWRFTNIPSHGIKTKESHENKKTRPTTRSTSNSASVKREKWSTERMAFFSVAKTEKPYRRNRSMVKCQD